jgi:hypothetical protein
MSNEVIIHKGRTMVLIVKMGMNVTGDTFTSEIRAEPDQGSPLLATWVVSVTDAVNGQLRLVLDDLVTKQIKATSGYMDLKRMSGGEPIAVFDRPLEVSFRGTVTA